MATACRLTADLRPTTNSTTSKLSNPKRILLQSGAKNVSVRAAISQEDVKAVVGAVSGAAMWMAGSAAAVAAENTSALSFTGSESSFGFAVASGGALAAVAAALVLTDPEKRRQKQAEEVGGDEKDVVRNYFNTSGFDRWRKIYGETDEVNSVQRDIREGHAQTVEKVINWLKKDGGLAGVTICDAGCGTGSLAIPLAIEGAVVSASDISSAMVQEGLTRAESAVKAAGKGSIPNFFTSDLESLSGKFHTVTCLDVFIHYPQDKAGGMIAHLASLAEKRLIISFAPYTPYYAVLKRIGELFPGPSKATRAYLHAEQDVELALQAAGWKVVNREMTATKFYFSRLLEAVPIQQ